MFGKLIGVGQNAFVVPPSGGICVLPPEGGTTNARKRTFQTRSQSKYGVANARRAAPNDSPSADLPWSLCGQVGLQQIGKIVAPALDGVAHRCLTVFVLRVHVRIVCDQ